jgi:DNA-binding transcriptional LysR family regulator
LKALRLTLRQLQIFVAVARAGSTTAAGADIGLSQSATSAALNELESLLGGKLFNRVGRRLVLNENGRSMLPQARWVLDAAQGIEARFGHAGKLALPQIRIAASTTTGNYLLPRVLAAWQRREGGARFTLDIGNTREVVKSVVALDADLGFIEGPTTEPQLRVVPWMRDELVVVASPRHPLARARRKVPLEALRRATWLLREPGSGTREVVEAALMPHLRRLRAEGEVASSEALKEAVAEGAGLACLSRHAVADLVKLRRLAVLPTTLPRLERDLYLIHHERRYLTPALQGFIGFALSTYRRRR